MNKNWIIRSLTGIVYIAVIVAGVLLHGIPFLIMSLLLAIPAMIEFKRITLKDVHYSPTSTVLDALTLIFALASIVCTNYASIFGFLSLLMLIVRIISVLYLYSENPIRTLTSSLSTLIYIGLPMVMMAVIEMFDPLYMLLTFILIWLNDTGAFIVGSLLGRHRLFERISPKKSWEGFFGGMIFTVAGAIAACEIFPGYYRLPIPAAVILGLTVTIAATYGDLIESCIKRTAGVKDSGNILPGHGGMLDRIDSLLLVAPCVATFLMIFFAL